MPDARKTLNQLRAEWETCTKCDLGVRRNANDGAFVFGEGTPGGIMFIGEGPGREEEANGRPFIGASGALLRSVLKKLQVTDYYITNLVTCRSCEHAVDKTTGMSRFFHRKKGPPIPVFNDCPPTPAQWKTCIARLYEEIYIVDPVLIVTLGAGATEALTGGHISITRDRGHPIEIEVPGAGQQAVLTEKKRVWFRKNEDGLHAPVEQNQVRYLLYPVTHPAFVLRKLRDQGHNSPFQLFHDDIRRAVKLYEMYMEEVHGRVPTSNQGVTADESMIEYQNTQEDEDSA